MLEDEVQEDSSQGYPTIYEWCSPGDGSRPRCDILHDRGKPAAGPILKHDRSVQVCGDYKVIVNKSLQKEVYPLPTPDDLFTKLEGGVRFAKLHLSHAYNQVELDRESQLLVLNTHRRPTSGSAYDGCVS